MKRKALILLIVSSAFHLNLLSAPEQKSAESAGKTYTYKTVDGKPLQLAVFQPPGRGAAPVPAIILFHGGAWIKGEKSQLADQCQYFAGRGIVAVTVDYRFRDQAAPPDSFEGSPKICLADAKSAIRWVRSHATELGINPDRLILGGGSAGGHLATMAQLDSMINDPQDDVSIPTTGIALVLFNPAYATPANQLVPVPTAQLPPTIMFFGTKDAKYMPPGKRFLASCVSLGAKGQLWLAPDRAHGFFNFHPWTEVTLSKADEFLTSLGLLSPNPAPTPTDTAAKLVLEIPDESGTKP